MKNWIAVSLLCYSLSALADVPRCENSLWESSDFKLFTGGENCEGRVITCAFFGTRSEGWYSYPESTGLELRSGNCTLENRPDEYIGDMDIVCAYKKTDREGWYAFPSEERAMVAYSHCSDE